MDNEKLTLDEMTIDVGDATPVVDETLSDTTVPVIEDIVTETESAGNAVEMEPADAEMEEVIGEVSNKKHEMSSDNIDLLNQTDDFIGDDVDTFKLLGLQSKLNDLGKITEQLKNGQNEMLGDVDDEFIESLDAVAEGHTVEELKAMTPEDIDDIYSIDGEIVNFDIPFDNDKQEFEFKRDYLIMRKQTMESIAKLDAEMASINAELAEHQEELNHILDEYGDMEGLIRSKLVTKFETSTDEVEKELYAKMITAFDNALTLDNIKEYLKSYKGKSLIADYRDAKRSQKVYKKYLKVIEDLQINTKLAGFRNLEKKFLVVDDNTIYNKRPNIFVFSVIHYIASWYNKSYSKADGLFITQFVINLKDLYYDKFVKPENKTIFLENIKQVIDIIG